MDERKDILTWDEYFMTLALVCAKRSKDPSTRVGACLVDEQNKVISLGYNGMPTGCLDCEMPWGKEEKQYLKTKYPFVCHAELNAVLNASSKQIKNSRIYTTLFPCNECAKTIIQAGIVKVIYLSDENAHTDSVKAAKHMFNLTKISYVQFKTSGKQIILNI